MNHNRRRALIFSGGRLDTWALSLIKSDDLLIGADKGALFLIEHHYRPDLAIGDFDSVTEEEKSLIQKKSKKFLSTDAILKDESDTELALIHAVALNPSEIVLIGVLGSRFDHSLANIQLLHKALSLGVSCCIIDEHNMIRLIDRPTELQAAEDLTYVSLLPITLEVTGVTLTGFQYPLHEATLQLGSSLSISNKLIAEVGHIELRSGMLLVIQSRDE